MTHLMRFLVLYDWPEAFDLSKRPEVLVRLVEDAQITPNKATFFVAEEKKERRRTLTKKSNLMDVASSFMSYTWVALDEPIEGDFRDVRSHLSFHADIHRYAITKLRSGFSLGDVVRHLRLACEFVTPRYGFSHSVPGFLAMSFPWGVSTVSADRDVWRRIADLGNSLRVTKEHVAGKLHDVYGLNVLSPSHLERTVEGRPLGDWISAGGRGELLTIKDEVFAWIVPDEVRPALRATLFNEGALIATV